MKKYFIIIPVLIIALYGMGQEVLSVKNGAAITIQNGAAITLQGGITLEIGSNLTNNGSLQLKNNVVANGSDWIDNSASGALSGTGIVIFNSTNNHNFSGATNYYAVQMNAGGLSLNNNFPVSNLLHLINGKINTSAHFVFLNNNTSASLINEVTNAGYANSWINGNFRRLITSNTSTYDFPVGNATRSNLLQFANNNIAGTNFLTASFGPKPGTDAGLNVVENGNAYTSINNGGVWYLVPGAAPSGGSYALQLYFNGFTGLTDNQFGILRRPDASSNAADWMVPVGSSLEPLNGSGRKVSDGFALRKNISNFSQLGIGEFIKDNTPPVIVCPSSQTLALGNACTAILPDYRNLATVSDNYTPAASIVITQSPAPGTTVSGKGIMNVKLEAKDAAGNISSCTFSVNKKDNTAPQITCPPNITVFAKAGKCNAVVSNTSLGTATAKDNCTATVTIVKTGVPAGNIFPVGTTTITYKATDASNNTAICTQTVTVVDNQPPVISSISASPDKLWPPNHKMEEVTINYKSSDNCNVGICSLSVTSNEPVNGTGDGDTAPDWQIINDHKIKLRAERAGTGNGRIYSITITCTDKSGNKTTATTKVKVNHDSDDDDDDDDDRPGGAVTISGTDKKAAIQKDETDIVEGLQVAAYPNPTNNHFRIEIKTNNKQEKIMIQVYDILGRRVEMRNNVQTGASILVGDKYKQGAYFIRVMQGNEYKVMKLIKLSY